MLITKKRGIPPPRGLAESRAGRFRVDIAAEEKSWKRQNCIVHWALTRIDDHSVECVVMMGTKMQRLRLKADGRIVELRDGCEIPFVAPGAVEPEANARSAVPGVRDLRRRAQLTQIEFAARLGVPVDTIRNWEQGKRLPRGPARALLTVIAHAPETAFAALGARRG